MFECALLNKKSTDTLFLTFELSSVANDQSRSRVEEFQVLHEPMGDAFYFGPEKVSTRYKTEDCPKEMLGSTFAKVSRTVCLESNAR